MDGTGSAGPAQPALARAAATVLLGIRGLVVTAVTETPDGLTLVEVITDPAFEAADRAPRRVHRGPAGPAGLAQDPLALRHTRLRAGNFHRMAAGRQAPGPADLPAADLPGRGRRR